MSREEFYKRHPKAFPEESKFLEEQMAKGVTGDELVKAFGDKFKKRKKRTFLITINNLKNVVDLVGEEVVLSFKKIRQIYIETESNVLIDEKFGESFSFGFSDKIEENILYRGEDYIIELIKGQHEDNLIIKTIDKS